MPRPPKRRSDATDAADSDDERQTQQHPPRRRRRSSSASSSDASSSDAAGSAGSSPASPASGASQQKVMIKKVVRLALATEYSRTPLRRSDITAKVFKDTHKRGQPRVSFKSVLDGAQQVLQDTFGMQLVELPSREKSTLKDRRAQATQAKASAGHGGGAGNKSWILTSTLPAALKTDPAVAQPTRAPTVDVEASYTALYTFVLALVYLNNNALAEQKLERYLKRVNAETYTPLGSLDKLLQRMVREGYLEKRRDTSSGEEVVEWTPGPRGKVEVGAKGVAGLVRTVYGYGSVPLARGATTGARRGDDSENEAAEGANRDQVARLVKVEEAELNARLGRSLGIKLDHHPGSATVQQQDDVEAGGDGEPDSDQQEEEIPDDQPGPSTRSRPSTQLPSHARSSRRSGGRRAGRIDDLDDD